MIENMPAFSPTVVTRSERWAHEWDEQRPYRVVRRGAHGRRMGSLGPIVAGTAVGLRTNPDIVLAGHLVAAPAALALAALRRIPFALYLYADELPHHRRLLVRAMRHAAVTIAISPQTRDLAASLGAPVDRCVIIPPGVDVPTLPSGEPEPGLIVTVARLTDRYKGHDLILDALPRIRERVPDARWVVVGDGPLRLELEARARALCLEDAVQFVGNVDDEHRDDWLRRATVFTMPARLPPHGGGEGFGIVFLEAGAHGLPVVAGNVGGALAAVHHGVTGLLVDPSSPAGLADALVSVLRDPALARRLGAAGRANAEAHAWPAIARELQDVLEAIAEGRSARERRGTAVASRRPRAQP